MKFLSIFLLCCFLGFASAIVRGKETRIVGGAEATVGAFPFVVSIIYRTSNGQYFCGGALVERRWVLTSGSCTNGAIQFTLLLGTHLRQGASNGAGLAVATSTAITHPSFSLEPLQNDIALIELREDVQYNEWLHPGVFPSNPLADFTSVVAVGWGTTGDADDDFQNILNRVAVISLPNSECRSYYGNQVVDTMVCIDGNFNEGTCYGDMGGPLIQYDRAEILVGVASFISGGGCESEYPSGFTRVYPFLDWIRTYITPEVTTEPVAIIS